MTTATLDPGTSNARRRFDVAECWALFDPQGRPTGLAHEKRTDLITLALDMGVPWGMYRTQAWRAMRRQGYTIRRAIVVEA